MPSKQKNNREGFTLIELLVVVAIIGVLASVVLASLNTARAKARDARRLADVKQIQTALEMYFDNYGYYPQRAQAYTNADTCGGTTNWCNLVTDLAPYLPIAGDPLGHQIPYYYYYDSDSGDNYQTYGFSVMFESSSNSSKESNDGGYYTWAYEVGQQPTYCMGKYIGAGGGWGIDAVAATVCTGGN